MPKQDWYEDYVKQVHGEDVAADVPRDEDGEIDLYTFDEPEAPAEGEDTYAKPLESMKKDELVAEAQRRGVSVDQKDTKDEIIQTITNPVQTDFPGDPA